MYIHTCIVYMYVFLLHTYMYIHVLELYMGISRTSPKLGKKSRVVIYDGLIITGIYMHIHMPTMYIESESVTLWLVGGSQTNVNINICTRVKQVVSERHLMKYVVSECLAGENVEVKIAACKCLHSLSRSTKLLRTAIIDTEAWKHVVEVHIMLYMNMYPSITPRMREASV